jgi:hypothetical protein
VIVGGEEKPLMVFETFRGFFFDEVCGMITDAGTAAGRSIVI